MALAEKEIQKMDSRKVTLRAIGKRIAEMRHAKGLTQQQLADESNLSCIFISSIEEGKRGCSLSTSEKIVTTLGFTMNDLVGDNFCYPVFAPLSSEVSEALASCNTNEQEAILQFINALVNMIHLFRDE